MIETKNGQLIPRCSGDADCLCPTCIILMIHGLSYEDLRFGVLLQIARTLKARVGMFGVSALFSALRPKSVSLWKITIERRAPKDVPVRFREDWISKGEQIKQQNIAHEVIIEKKKAGKTLNEAFDIVAARPWHNCSGRTIGQAYYSYLAKLEEGYRDPIVEALKYLSFVYGADTWSQIAVPEPVVTDDFPRRKGERGRPRKISKK